MTNLTFGAAREKLENDLDLHEEKIITSDELIGYFNDALKEAEGEILKLNEDYFLDFEYLPLVLNQTDYALPKNIFAMKVRHIFYSTSVDRYEIHRIKDLRSTLDFDPNDRYRYVPVNQKGVGPRMRLYPASRETAAQNVTVWFIRHANRIPKVGDLLDDGVTIATQADVDATEIDIPEFVTFVWAWVKMLCLAKYNGGTPPPDSVTVAAQARQQMIETLSDKTPDENNTITPDTSFYRDFDTEPTF
jgi:hypothetical protein